MGQVDNSLITISLDMRLLDQYRVSYDKYTKAEDLIKMMVDKIDEILSKFNVKRRNQVFYIRLKAMKIRAVAHYREHDDYKSEIAIALNSVEATKNFNLNKIKNQMFEDSLFKSDEGRKVKNDFKEAKVYNSSSGDSYNVLRKTRHSWKRTAKKSSSSTSKKARNP